MRHTKSAINSEMFVFDSVTDMTDYTDANMWDKLYTKSENFLGEKIESGEQLRDKIKSAWEYGLTVLGEYSIKLENEAKIELKSHKRKIVYSTEGGDEVDVEKSQEQGQIVWRKYVREESTGPTEVTIITDTTTAYFMDSADILWRGAAAIALTKLLEDRGYKVELWVVNGTELYSGKDTKVCTACCLKRCSDPLDTSTLINTVAGWFYRTATFGLLNTICSKEGESVANGYGTCYTPKPQDLDELSRDELRIYSSGVYTFSGALDCIKAEVARFASKEKEQA